MPIRSFLIADLLSFENGVNEEECFKDYKDYNTALSVDAPNFSMDSGTISQAPILDQEKEDFSGALDRLPAWLFCTRYSDRPTAGMLLLSLVQVYQYTSTCTIIRTIQLGLLISYCILLY